jgi:hypothetical protein
MPPAGGRPGVHSVKERIVGVLNGHVDIGTDLPMSAMAVKRLSESLAG